MTIERRWHGRSYLLPVFAFVVCAYAWGGARVAPDMLRSALIERLRTEHGLSAQIGAVRIEPFALRVSAREIAVRDRDQRPLLEAAEVSVDIGAIASVRRRALVLSELVLRQPVIHVTRAVDGRTNLERIAVAGAQSAAPSRPLHVDRLIVQAARLELIDRAHTPRVERSLEDLSLSARDIRTDGGDNRFELTTRMDGGALLQLQGSMQLEPFFETRGTLSLRALRLRELLPWVRPLFPLTVLEGTVSLSGSFGLSQRPGALSELLLAELAVDELRVAAHAESVLSAKRLQLTSVRIAPLARRVVVGRMALIEPRAALSRGQDGTLGLNIPPAKPSRPSEPWDLRVDALELVDGRLALQQETRRGHVRLGLTSIQLRVRQLSSDASARSPVELSMAVETGGRLTLDGFVTREPASAHLTLRVAALELAPFQALIEDLAPVRLHAGALDVRGRLLAGVERETLFEGAVAVAGLRVAEPGAGEDLFRAERIQVEGVTARVDGLRVEQLRLESPEAHVAVERDGTLNLSRLRTGPLDAASNASEGATPSEYEVRVDELELADMSVHFADRSIEPSFALPIRAMHGTVKGLSSEPNQAASVDLRGMLGRSAPVSIQGRIQPFDPAKDADVRLRAGNISLPIFNPYSGPLAGYSIDQGELAMNVRYVVVDDRLRAEHSLSIDQLKWGPATEQKAKAPLPVKLATALLRDRHGVIQLELPVKGTVDEPSFRIGPLVWQAIKNVLTKAVTAPFDMLGKWFRGAERARDVEFGPGEAEPSEASRTALAALGEAMIAREELKVEVPTEARNRLDRVALADKKVQAAIAAKLAKRHASYAKLRIEDQLDVLEDLYRERTGKAPPRTSHGRSNEDIAKRTQLERLIREETPATTVELEELGQERAEAVERCLTASGRLPATRVVLSRSGTVVASADKVRMRLELQE
jgi:uncharacterized protein involved in outer membrane biogenesis